jgi:hypothetical protein
MQFSKYPISFLGSSSANHETHNSPAPSDEVKIRADVLSLIHITLRAGACLNIMEHNPFFLRSGVTHLINKFTAPYETRSFMIVLMTACRSNNEDHIYMHEIF